MQSVVRDAGLGNSCAGGADRGSKARSDSAGANRVVLRAGRYYLALERGFRESYSAFVGKVHTGEASASDLYTVAASGSTAAGVVWAMFRSFSVLPFYVVVAAMVFLAWCLIL